MSEPAGDSGASLRDEQESPVVLSSERVFAGAIWDIRRDTVEFGDSRIVREYVDHPGAVAVLALDDDDNVLLIRQYRQPISARDWELPAGLLDIPGEQAVLAAQRELGEETDFAASDWHLLCEFFTTPGGSNEAIRVFLARGLTPTPHAFERFDEEAELETRWVPLDEVVESVLRRELTNSILGFAVLAASASRAGGWQSLGDPREGWPWHPKSRRDTR